MRMNRFARVAARTAHLSISNHNCRIHSNGGSYRGHTPDTNSARSLGGTSCHGHFCDFLKQFWKDEIAAEKRDRSKVRIMGGYVFIISRFHKINSCESVNLDSFLLRLACLL